MLEMNHMPEKSGRKPSLSEDDQREMDAAAMVLEPFLDIRHDMPLRYAHSFLMVAREEGLGVNEYAQKAGVSASVMSRHLLDIGDRDRNMRPGFGLVTKEQDKFELRKFRVYLTPLGRQLAEKISRVMRLGRGAGRH